MKWYYRGGTQFLERFYSRNNRAKLPRYRNDGLSPDKLAKELDDIRGQERYRVPTIGATVGGLDNATGRPAYQYATSGRIWLVNQRRIVRNEPPHSPEFNARTWTLVRTCVRMGY